jgi:transcriptional regulator with XRE-family HTH domain
MKDDRLQHTIDLLKRCGEAKGMTITEEEMAGKIGLSAEQLRAYAEGHEPTPDRLRSRLRAAYRGLITAIEQDGYRNALESIIRAIKGIGSNIGVTITEEEMAGKIGMSVAELQAYINGEQPAPGDMPQRLMSAFDDLHKEIQQRNRSGHLRVKIDIIRRKSAEEGKEITGEEMAGHLGMTGEELAACLKDPGKTQEEFSALSDRLWAAYPELLKNVRTVTVSSVKESRPPLHVELRMDEHWDEVLDE